MDKLEFIIQEKQMDDSRFETVTILINGKNIIDQLKEYELPFAKKEDAESIAGGYDNLPPRILYEHLTDLDNANENYKASIFECECGVDGCWPMKIKIQETENEIIWSDFEQPHRNKSSHNHWSYENFGKFTFEKVSYNKELKKLKK